MAIAVAVVLVAVGAYLGATLGLQRRVLYPRPPRPAAPPQLPAGAERVWLGQARDVEAWLLPPTGPPATPPAASRAGGVPSTASPTSPAASPAARPVDPPVRSPTEPLPAPPAAFPLIIYTHGNGELIDHWVEPFARITAAGLGVLLVEYPGYGRSGGRPNQRSISEATLAAYDFALTRAEVDAGRIVAYGRSLGGAAACILAANRPIAALVLESSFTRTADVLPRVLPPAWVLDPFDNLAVVATGVAPTLVLHGTRDRVIPASHGERLAQAAGTTAIPMPCGHNDCPRPWPAILGFLRRQGIVE